MDFEDFAERIRMAADLVGGQLELSKRAGISSKSINSYALGTAEPSRLRLIAMAKAAGVSTGWLATGEGPMRLGHSQMERPAPSRSVLDRIRTATAVMPMPGLQGITDDNGQVVIPVWQDPDPELFDYVPMAEATLSAGGGYFVLSEEMQGYYAFRKDWLSRVASSTKNLVLMRVHGESMSATIQDRDTVMIDTGRRDIKEGMIYALRASDTIMIKRLSFRPGGKILVISDNRQEFDPYEADAKDLYVIGQIIFFSRSFISD